MHYLRLTICIILLFGLNSSAQIHKAGTFTPGAVWPDDRGIHINAHGTFIISLPGKKNKWIFMADRWNPTNASDGRYVWLPLEFQGKKPVIRWTDNWKITDF